MSLKYAEVFDFYFEKRDEVFDINETIKINAQKELFERGFVRKDTKNVCKENQEKYLLKLLNLYIVVYGQHNYKGYLGVKRALKKNNIELDDRNDDNLFAFLINYIKKCNQKNQFYALKKYGDSEIENWVLNDKEDYNQAWHLLVSYILYQEINGKFKFSSVAGEVNDLERTEFKYWGKCQNVELMLWMAIVAGIEGETIEKVLKKVIKMEAGMTSKKVICGEIRKAITWENVEKKIKEHKKNA